MERWRIVSSAPDNKPPEMFFFFFPAIEVALQTVFVVTTRVEHIRTDLNRSVLLLEEEEESMHLCN
jgi:hypothetical protein